MFLIKCDFCGSIIADQAQQPDFTATTKDGAVIHLYVSTFSDTDVNLHICRDCVIKHIRLLKVKERNNA